MIKLKQIRLINWYAFGQITVPIGSFTLIAGKNGNGKSVFLDAVKYALYGDTVFNKSTENRGSRTVPSYTRGLLDATAGTYMRPADKMPNVYTHIVLEMEEVPLKRKFLLGTAIDTDSGNGCKTQRYVIENKTLSDVAHTYVQDGQTIPYSTSELQKAYGLKMMDVREGLSKFMQRTGLRLNEQQLAAFRRKLRSIMSYDPNAKIDQFIRESVLEEKKVDFSKLVEAKNNIDTLNANFEIIDAEIRELEGIIKLFDELRRARNTILADDVKITYKRFLKCQKALEEASGNMEIAARQIDEDEKQLKVIEVREKETRTAYNSAKENLNSMDCAKAIVEAEEILQKAYQLKERMKEEKERLLGFQTKVSELIAWFAKEQYTVPQQKILFSLTEDIVTRVQKESCAAGFLEEIKKRRDEILSKITRIKDELESNQREQDKCRQIIDDCEAKKTTFSEIPDYVALKNEINREFEKRKIKSEARFACEYVLGLKDEAWRDSVEGYLGRRRYTILVEPEYYDIADDILNASKNKYAHLFNTKLLMKKRITPEEDSVVRFIEVKNPVAKQYFDYQLGRFHAVDRDKVRNYENAMSKEGRVSVAMDSYFLRFDSIRFYCFGQEAIELNRIRAVKKLENLRQVYSGYKQQMSDEKSKMSYLDTQMNFFGEYNYDACREYEEALVDCSRKESELKALKEAQKNNMEYMELAQRVSGLEQELKAVEGERGAVYENKSQMLTEYNINKNNCDKSREDLDIARKELKEYKAGNNTVYAKAIEDYDKFIANGKIGPGGTLKDRKRAERTLEEAGKNLRGGQASYNASRTGDNQLPMTDSSIAYYQERKSRIWMDDREEIQAKLKEQTRRYEEIFKNEFVLTVLKSCEAARDDLKLINAELSRLEFKSKYAFDVKYVKDGSDYEKILEYARYLKEREDIGTSSGQMTLDAITSYSDGMGEGLEQDIKKIINRIVESNDKEKIEHYADYRNYMTYEILLTNDVLTKAKLSKQSGYNSGAEVQIPYMLILLSALLMIYNDKNSSTRLVFIDEPFAKMDPTNVKIMLGFMEEQNLQMIFCAPDKTELIGNECDVVLPVLRTRPDLMEMGFIDIHKGV
ncbi:SbcC/MukB-like Walker B domain-containing protein [Murimonas intestini]|uniref:SbcC/MukB-like Walker B domain-containing protein n=1 Tax=Murimonas intestini TaxID=1337051 RepID=UPI0011DD2F8F|nr:SbcC/MukB-like Walker B domain-containing protein [Murimonas intestini]